MLKKILVIVAIIAYDVSPVDLFPGPIDDLIVTVLGMLWTKAMSKPIISSDLNASTTAVEQPVIPANAVIGKMTTKTKNNRTSSPKKM